MGHFKAAHETAVSGDGMLPHRHEATYRSSRGGLRVWWELLFSALSTGLPTFMGAPIPRV